MPTYYGTSADAPSQGNTWSKVMSMDSALGGYQFSTSLANNQVKTIDFVTEIYNPYNSSWELESYIVSWSASTSCYPDLFMAQVSGPFPGSGYFVGGSGSYSATGTSHGLGTLDRIMVSISFGNYDSGETMYISIGPVIVITQVTIGVRDGGGFAGEILPIGDLTQEEVYLHKFIRVGYPYLGKAIRVGNIGKIIRL